ncbi:MAG: S8 family serine peptidase [Myxococcales bacterium]|nr:S8 family serine peptidase [Myxococcales bacterium]
MRRPSSRVVAFFALASVSFAQTLAPHVACAQSTHPGRDPGFSPVDPVGEDRGFGRPVLDPRVEYGFAMRAQLGTATPRFMRSSYFERTGEMPVVVRFVRAPTATTLRVFESRGVRWLRSGRPTVSGAYTAMVSEDGARSLAADPMVGRVECDLFPAGPRPLDASATETRVEQARRAIFARDGVELDGRGVVIGDIDSAIFLYHPAFYHADGGVLEWRDVNSNGTFDVGTDGVDLDRNGTIEPAEVLKLFSAHTYDARLQRTMPSSSLRPDLDWLYTDSNGNGRRDFGASFPEDTPAYGEPIFVVDDANRNGTLDPSERILRLKTPKIRGINSRMEFLRGSADAPLVAYDTDQTPQGFESELHATGVAGILLGGVPGVSRLLGLAPRAELVLTDYYGLGDNRDQGLVTGMQWVIDQGANVLVTEFAPYAGVTLDGSSEGEQLLDSFADNGGVPVSPAGNLATGFKHIHVNLGAGDNPIALTTDEVFAGARFAQFSVHYRSSSRRARVTIGVPGLAPMLLPESAPRGVQLGPSVLAAVESSVTSRGTRMVHVSIVSRSALPQGEWTAAVQMDAGPAVEADLYVGDDRSDWAGGFSFRDNDPTRTICYPSTSDKTISVAAYVLHAGAGFAGAAAMGDLARYSSRGPRLDGEVGIEIGAPDNPLSTLSMSGTRVPAGSYMPFGGTSGAGPHVAAAAALLRQLNPEAAPGAIRAMILDHARRDSFARSDNQTQFGAGKLDMAAALGITATTGTAPTLVLRSPARVGPMREARLEPMVTDDGPASELRARWDLDYDGTPDTPWQPVATQLVRAGVTGFVNVRVEVRDGQGYVAAATTRIQVVPLDQVPPEDRAFDPEFTPAMKGCGCATPGGRALDTRALTAMVLGAAAVALRWRRRKA